MTEQEGAACVLRLFGASSTAVGQAVENFPPRWEAAARWKSRGAETLVALTARGPSGLKKAVRALRERFPADVYGMGQTTLPAAAVDALEGHDKLLICSDSTAGALLEARLETVPGAEKVYDFGALSYAHPRTAQKIAKRAAARLPKDCTDPVRLALARAQAARRVVGADLSVGCAGQGGDSILVLSSRKGCWVRTVPAGENAALWLLDLIRRAAAGQPQAEGTGFLPGGRDPAGARKKAPPLSPGLRGGAAGPSAGGGGGSALVAVCRRRRDGPAGTSAHPLGRASAPARCDPGIRNRALFCPCFSGCFRSGNGPGGGTERGFFIILQKVHSKTGEIPPAGFDGFSALVYHINSM